jgi:tRNA dimethylallyltransferase
VPHHLLDLVSVAETFDVSQFVKAARRAVAEIQARGRVPILCGGTGLYFKAYLHGIREAPATDSALRSELERIPLEQLLAELRSGDPTTYERVDRKNPRRVLRAVAVLRLGGPRAAEQGPKWSNTPAPDHRHFGLERDAADLRERVDARVDDMFRCGLVEETQRLLGQGLEQNLTAMQALGYRQVVEQLRGERNLAATIELVKRRTRQYVKRQRTWFRRQMSLNWIRVRAEEPADQIAARIEAAIRGTPS